MNVRAVTVWADARKPGDTVSLGKPNDKARPFTQAERDFIELVAAGRGFDISARGCGMTPAEARRFCRRSDVREAFNSQREAVLLSDGVPAALRSVTDILDDEAAPHSTRAKLALGVLEYARKIANDDAQRSDAGLGALNNLTADELDAFAASARQAIEVEAKTIEGELAPTLEVSDLF